MRLVHMVKIMCSKLANFFKTMVLLQEMLLACLSNKAVGACKDQILSKMQIAEQIGESF